MAVRHPNLGIYPSTCAVENTTAYRPAAAGLTTLAGARRSMTDGVGAREGCCDFESRYHRYDTTSSEAPPSLSVSPKTKACEGTGGRPVQDHPIDLHCPNNLRRVPCCRGTLSPERLCASFPRPLGLSTPWEARRINSRGQGSSISRVDGPSWGRGRTPWPALRGLGMPSPLRAGSSCIRVCKYPDAHASRRRIEHELSRA